MTLTTLLILSSITVLGILFSGSGPSGPDAAGLSGALMVVGGCGVLSSLIWAGGLVYIAILRNRRKGGHE